MIKNSGRITTSNMNKLVQLANSKKRVFTAQDLAVIWGYSDEDKLFELIKYYSRQGEIFTLTRGLYSMHDYSEDEMRGDQKLLYEIANKLVPNSYVSLYTILAQEGVMHQYYDAIYSIAKRKVTRNVNGVKFEYRRVKDSVLLNDWGIVNDEGVRRATAERAVLDSRYLYPKWEIENLERVDSNLLKQGAKIYVKY